MEALFRVGAPGRNPMVQGHSQSGRKQSVVIYFHGPDSHADFPHRIVIPFIKVVIHGEIWGAPSASEYVICAHCDHWIQRPAGRCHCRYQCHQR
jgi:hypothetical protein